MTFFRLAFALCAITVLAACIRQPIPAEFQGQLRVAEVKVTFKKDAKGGLSRDVDENQLAKILSTETKAVLAVMEGVVPVQVNVKVKFYSMPTGAAALIPLATTGIPSIEAEVSLTRTDNSKLIGKPELVIAYYSTSGAVLVGSGAVHTLEQQMTGVSRVFAETTQSWLLSK